MDTPGDVTSQISSRGPIQTPDSAVERASDQMPSQVPDQAATQSPTQASTQSPTHTWGLSLDEFYHETDRLYYVLARDCGLSECAYWIMYAIEEEGGTAALRGFAERWSYSKQTVNSAVKALCARGLVELSFAEGSRKSKNASFTEAGRAFSRERIVPAMHAEARAFETLEPAERTELLRLLGKYTAAVHEEVGRVLAAGEDR